MKENFSVDEAQQVAIAALGFMAARPDLLARFFTLTGIAATDIRQAAAQTGFLAAVLQFLCAHEPDLLEFCNFAHIAPERVGAAVEILPGG